MRDPNVEKCMAECASKPRSPTTMGVIPGDGARESNPAPFWSWGLVMHSDHPTSDFREI